MRQDTVRQRRAIHIIDSKCRELMATLNPNPDLTDHIIRQGRALEALNTIEPTGPIERLLTGLLLAAYKRRLRGIVEAVPEWVVERILSASERIEGRQVDLWMSDN